MSSKITIIIFISIILNLVLVTSSKCQYPAPNKILEFKDDQDKIWIGTGGGLFCLDKTSDSFSYFNTEDIGLDIDIITAIEIDSFNNVWIGVYGSGCARYDRIQWSNFTPDNSEIPNGLTNEIKCVGSDTLLFGLSRYFTIFNGQNWDSIKTGSPWSSYISLNDFEIDSQKDIWIAASWGLGLYDQDTLYENYYGLHDDYRCDYTCLEIDVNDTLWIGLDGYGLLKFDDSLLYRYTTSNSNLPSDKIYDAAFDSKGNLWLAMVGGLVKYDKHNFYIYDSTNSNLNSHVLLSLEIDNKDNIWIGTWGDGLYMFDGDSIWKHFDLSLSDIEENNFVPSDFIVIKNYPNPFNSSTRIEYDLNKPANVEMKIYNIQGEKVKSLFSGFQSPGKKEFIWHGLNDYQVQVSSGLYFVRIEIEDDLFSKKLVLMK